MVVRPLVDDPNPPKDANEALLAGRDIGEFLEGEKWNDIVRDKQTDHKCDFPVCSSPVFRLHRMDIREVFSVTRGGAKS